MTKINPDHEHQTDWIIDAMDADFSTMPNPFTWDRSVKFAHYRWLRRRRRGRTMPGDHQQRSRQRARPGRPLGKRADSLDCVVWRAPPPPALRLPTRPRSPLVPGRAVRGAWPKAPRPEPSRTPAPARRHRRAPWIHDESFYPWITLSSQNSQSTMEMPQTATG